ncbi:hypothetical protein N0O92_05050 [Alkalihalobacillus sp. MEB130]|uniref:hypothetical protein n=1 Tax=Alkalihalobacillus sp. MEB130 TaxID=2976704 RepID=UPI0028DE5ABC|nr:hypothetical protein [Alkalihalobacillus sp. MEB130]MDT8859593.1 hypothetical protein [Alkalihalobacillus sp. MEB130]
MANKSMIASVVTAAATTILLGNRERRAKIIQTVQNLYKKGLGKSKEKHDSQIKIGHSHPYDYEDNKMVGEGALTSVQHYNQMQQKNHSEKS